MQKEIGEEQEASHLNQEQLIEYTQDTPEVTLTKHNEN